MSPSRNLRRLFPSLAFLAGLAGLLWLRLPGHPGAGLLLSQMEAKKSMTPEARIVGPVRGLEQGKPIEMELRGGEGHAYEIALETGQYLHLVVEQKGLDVALRVKGPGGGGLTEVDSPTGAVGPEHFFVVAAAPGLWRVEVVSDDESALPGKYQISAEPPRTATEEDRRRAEAWALFNGGEALRREKGFDSYRKAVAKYQRALALWREIADQEWEAESLYRIGWMDQELTDYKDALSNLQAALPLYQTLGKRVEEGIVLNRIGETQLRLGEWESAREAHERAANIFRETAKQDLESQALSGLGNALNALGKTQQALETFRSALERAEAVRDFEGEFLALIGLGDVLLSQGKLEESRDALQDALRISVAERNRGNEALIQERVADVDQRLGRFAQALEELEKTLKIREELQDRNGQANVLSKLGTANLLARKLDAAGLSYQRALALYRERGNRHGEALALLNLGRHACESRDYRRCLSFHEQAAELYRTLEDRRSEVSNQFGLARALSGLEDLTAARAILEKVLNQVEEFRSEADSIDLRTSYLATRQRYYELYIDVLMRLAEKNPESLYSVLALEINERRRARGLLDQLMESESRIERGADTSLLARERELQNKVNALERARLRGGSRDLVATIERQQRDLLQQLEEVRTKLRAASPRYAELARPTPLKLEEIQERVLDKGTLLLVYSLGEERSFLWCIHSQGKVTTAFLPSRSAIERVARDVRLSWSRSSAGRHAAGAHWAAWLSRELLGKVADQLTTRRVLILGDGALEALPFAALPDPRSLPKPEAEDGNSSVVPLVTNHEIIYLPSASVLATLRVEVQKRTPAHQKIAVIANPVFGADDPRLQSRLPSGVRPGAAGPGASSALARSARDAGISGFEPLPYSAMEAQAIAELVPPQQRSVATDFGANLDAVLKEKLTDCQILHFATHGILNSTHPELSGLVLSLVDEQGHAREGFLLAHEIANLNLRADLAVLSACETGLGEEVRGEGIISLTRSFMYAGVPRIIVSLWSVNDQGTAELMKRFYRCHIKKNYPAAAALRCAQLSMMKDPRWSNPYYWAPFVFQGEWRRRGENPKDDGIEKQVAGTGGGGPPVTDYPPPILGGPIGCPDDLGKDE